MFARSSSFKLHRDGISIGGYSIRLSNFSFNNIATNMVRSAGFVVSVGVVMADTIGVTSLNGLTHYKLWGYDQNNLSLLPEQAFCLKFIKDALTTNRICGVLYDASRQDEYWDMKCKLLHTVGNQYRYVALCRGKLQPIVQTTEDCLKGLMNEALSAWNTVQEEERLQKKLADEERERKFNELIASITPSPATALKTVGLFAAIYASYRVAQWYNAPKPQLTFEQRVENIGHKVDGEHDFCCPIDKVLMDDPVIANDGKSYGRSALEEWLKKSNKSPLTGVVIDPAQIQPNYELRKQIEAFVSGLEKEHAEINWRRRQRSC